MSFYAYPTHDDFPSVRLASEAWATTGSLWATLKAAWDQAMYDYQTWQGTYVAMFVCAFQPMAFSMRLFLACAVWRAYAACAVGLVSGAPDHKVRAQGGSVRMRRRFTPR